MNIQPGARAIFTHVFGTDDETGIRNHSGQTVTVVRELGDDECDPECQRMFHVIAADGWEGDAWDEELSPVGGES